MKHFYFFVCLLFIGNSVDAQNISFADSEFKSRLLGANPTSTIAKDINGNNITIDLNWDGEIEVSEALNVYQIGIYQNNNLPYIVSINGIENFPNLIKIAVMDQHLTQVDCSALVNLQEINFSFNHLTSLNVSGLIHLKKINVNNNLFTSFDTSSLVALEYLECSGNQISALNLSNSVNLQKLHCLYNNLSSLNIVGLSALTEVNCEYNHLPTLNLSGLTSIVDFRCGSNEMTSISFPDSDALAVLYCGGNYLTSVDLSNLTMLGSLWIGGNQLTSIDLSTQTNLVQLYCDYNLLTELDISQTNLYDLTCEYNTIGSIDISSSPNLHRLNCSNNPNLAYLNLKNGYYTNYNLFMNNIPQLTYVCVDEEEFYEIQYKVQNYSGSSNCEVNTYCSFVPGGNFYTIHGNQKIDADDNGCDANDLPFPNFKLTISDGIHTGNFISNEVGNYSVPVFAATHTVTPVLENPSYFNISPSSFQVTFPNQVSPFNQNFCITPNGIHQDLEVSIIPLSVARPGFDATYKIIYKNKGNVSQSGTVTLSYEDDLMDLVSSNPTFSNQSFGMLSWNYDNLLPFETRIIDVKMNINSPMETPPVNMGDQLDFATTINPLTGDEYLPDNIQSLKQIVVNSLDPNDKTCLEGNTVGPEMIGQYVHYVIRFENTGTFPAENIVVKDMIDLTKFDLNSLIPIGSSHSFVTRIANDGKVEFIFENIQLPFDDANNDGFIAFKIKTKPTLVLGDTFANNAGIYFDYNFPIITNTATTTIQALGNQDFEFSNYFSLYPNPANGVLNIKTKETITLQSISVYNVLGQMVLVFPNVNQVDAIDISNLKAGSYFIKLVTDKGTASSKFVKK